MPDVDPGCRDPADELAAIVLAGGRAARLGGADKPGLVVGTRTLLAAVVSAAAEAGAGQVVVVGPARPGIAGSGPVSSGPVSSGRVEFVREDPPGTGPVAALRCGLGRVGAPWVAVLAADMPFLRARHLVALLAAAGSRSRARAGQPARIAPGRPATAQSWSTKPGGRSGSRAAGRPPRSAAGWMATQATHCTACWTRSGRSGSAIRPARTIRRPGWTVTPRAT